MRDYCFGRRKKNLAQGKLQRVLAQRAKHIHDQTPKDLPEN